MNDTMINHHRTQAVRQMRQARRTDGSEAADLVAMEYAETIENICRAQGLSPAEIEYVKQKIFRGTQDL